MWRQVFPWWPAAGWRAARKGPAVPFARAISNRRDKPSASDFGYPAPIIRRRWPNCSPSRPRDGGWAGFLLAQLDATRPLLWVQERMAILEGGRIYPPGLAFTDLIHVEARDSKAALWAMEEGLRCAAIGAVIGEIWGDPAALDFTATRRLAVAAERHGVAAWLVRLGGRASLSGARRRWRVASAPSLDHPFESARAGRSGVGCRAVSRARHDAGAMAADA